MGFALLRLVSKQRRVPGPRFVATRAWQQPLSGKLPEPLRATDGRKPGAPPEDVFTLDTITKRMPKIIQSTVAAMPSALKTPDFEQNIKALQDEMKDGAQLRLLTGDSPRVGADRWNEHLTEFIDRGEGWHTAPWWVVENYMYKRLLEEMDRCGSEAASYDPFEAVKLEALEQSAEPLESSLQPLVKLTAEASEEAPGSSARREALEASLLRSLWGNQADLSLSAGEVTSVSGGQLENLVSDHRSEALDLLLSSKKVVVVMDNYGLEVLCDLVLVDAILSLTDSSVSLHVKDAPVFVSDVTDKDVPKVLKWLETRLPELAERLNAHLGTGRLKAEAYSYYTTARSFWEVPAELQSDFSDAAVVLKGDANFRRLLGDLHWPYDTDFAEYARSFWQGSGLICLRTMKSGVAIGIPDGEQERAQEARKDDWLTSGVFGQVLTFARGA